MKTIEEEAELWAKYQKEIRLLGQRVSTCRSTEDFQVDAFIAGAEFAQRWIPVEDELPEEGVLVFAKSGNEQIDINICCFKNKKFIMRFAYQPSDYSYTYKFRENITESITHWRPINQKWKNEKLNYQIIRNYEQRTKHE